MSFSKFLGQPQIVRHMERIIDGCISRKECLPHHLLAGGSGMGKTAFAAAIAFSFDSRCQSFICAPELTPEKIYGVLSELSASTFIFFDEAHALARSTQEALLPLLSRNVMMIENEDGMRIEVSVR